MATEKRLIDANEAKKKLRAVREWFVGHPSSEQDKLAQAVVKLCIEEIEKVKPADAVEVVHGQWVSDKADILFHCSLCETQISTDWDYDDLSWNYCPNCGAKMDAERRTDNG